MSFAPFGQEGVEAVHLCALGADMALYRPVKMLPDESHCPYSGPADRHRLSDDH